MAQGFVGGRHVWEFRFEMRKMLFPGSLVLRVDTLVPSCVEGSEIAFSWICLHEVKASCIRIASPQASVYHGWEERLDNWRWHWINLCMRDSKFLWKNSQDKLISEEVETAEQAKCLMAAWRPCQSDWVKCQTWQCWDGSLITDRVTSTLTSMWSDEPIVVAEEQAGGSARFEVLGRKLVVMKGKTERVWGVEECTEWERVRYLFG